MVHQHIPTYTERGEKEVKIRAISGVSLLRRKKVYQIEQRRKNKKRSKGKQILL